MDRENARGNGNFVVPFMAFRIKGGDGRKVHETRWWQIKEAGESNTGKSLRLTTNQNGETQTSFMPVGTGSLTCTVYST